MEQQTNHGTIAVVEHKPSPQLNPESYVGQLFWLAIFFVVLYVLIAKSAMPRIVSTLEKRQQRISEDLDRAEVANQQAEAARASYEKLAADSRERANSLIGDSLKEGEHTLRSELSSLEESLSSDLEAAIKALSDKATSVEAELQPAAQRLGGLIVEKLLGGSAPAMKQKTS